MAQAAGYSFNPSTVDGATVRDLAGYFLHGTVVGSAAITTGKYGDGLSCTGGALRVPVQAFTYPLNTDGGLSVAAWVKLSTATAAARVIASAAANSTLVWAVYASNASGNVEAVLGGTAYGTTTSIRDGEWHHVLVTLDRTSSTPTVRIVVDGTQVLLQSMGNAPSYTGAATLEAGRNALTGTQPLDGIVDDLRWWNDPVQPDYWSTLVAAEQTDHQLAIYPFDDDTAGDYGSYGRELTVAGSATYAQGLYGRALVADGTGAAASGAVDFPDCDRLSITGWMRLDTAPSGSASPVLAINDTLGNPRVRVVVNTDRTMTATWHTIADGTVSVTSANALTVGKWTRVCFEMNPTYVGIRVDSATRQITNMGDGVPHLTPAVDGLDVLYIGGDATMGSQVSFDYLTFTKNFLNEMTPGYWTGAPVATGYRPANIARGVYHFNENTGTTAVDESPSGNNLTLTPAGSWVAGIQGSSLGSNGTGPGASATITWPASPAGWAFSAWVRCRTSSSGARFLVLRGTGGEVAHAGRLNGLFWVRLFGAGGTTGIINPSQAPIPDETWTHVAASCDQTGIQFFFNGKWVYAAAYTAGQLLQPNAIAVGGDNPDSSLADVDDLRLFDTPISTANVDWLYRNAGQFYPSADIPTGVTATAISDDRIDLAWDAVPTAVAYDIERDGAVLVTNHAANTYSDTGLEPQTMYEYRVRSVL